MNDRYIALVPVTHTSQPQAHAKDDAESHVSHMSDTPRTDAEVRDNRPSILEQEMREIESVHADFARQLERELAAANRSCDACLAEIDRLRAERNRKDIE